MLNYHSTKKFKLLNNETIKYLSGFKIKEMNNANPTMTTFMF